jgi:hypothetical protein
LEYFSTSIPEVKFGLNTERIQVTDNYAQVFIYHEDVELKIDFVNDIAVRFDDIIIDKKLGKIDSLRNILSNKISALYRFEIKDYIDIWYIAKNYKFNWRRLINEAKQKEASLNPLEILNLFRSFPFEHLELIKWIKPPNYDQIKTDFFIIADNILSGGDNSLK